MPAQIEKAIFSLSKGEVSDPFETPGGFQIFKVDDTKDERTPTLKEASAEINKILKTEKAKREAAKAADRDREKALSGSDFNKIAQDSRAPLKVTELFCERRGLARDRRKSRVLQERFYAGI